MRKQKVYETVISGFPLIIEQDQTKAGRFTVTYGKQVRTGLDYVAAAREFGLCAFHALACDGRLNNDGV